MSICRSEALFSSMRDSATMAVGARRQQQQQQQQGLVGGDDLKQSLIQDSLIDGAGDLDFSEQVKANKNHYTLTYSSNGGTGAGSIYGSMMTSSSAMPSEVIGKNIA